MTESGRVVVAGAGLAGFRTVEELRERGFAGPITLVGAEPRPPYDRPPLSKKFLAEPGLDPSLKADFAALEVDFRPDEAATGLGDELITSRGAYPFDHLVLATGALPVALPGDGRQRFLRTYDDALALRDLLKPGGLALAGGEWLAADEVVTAVGVRPATGWLEGSGLRLENGVAVDAGLRASLPGVYAVGDCAAFESRRFGRRLRFEHWDVALHAPEVVAANVLGGDEAYDPVPYFWSEQFGRMMHYVGYHGDAESLLWRGDPAEPTWAACWLAGGRLVAMLTVGRPRDMLQGRRLIASADPVDSSRLTDPAIPVKAAAAA